MYRGGRCLSTHLRGPLVLARTHGATDVNYLDRVLAAKGDAEALFNLAVQMSGVITHYDDKASPKKRKVAEVRETWLTAACDAYEAEMGKGSFRFGPAAAALAALKESHTPEEIGKRLGYYVRSCKRKGETRFMSLPRFAQTFGEWDGESPAFDE